MNPFTDLFGNIIKAASACCCRPKVRPACAVGYSCTHSMETPPSGKQDYTQRNAITAEPGEHTLLSDNGWTRCSQLCHPPMARVGQYSWSEGGSQWIVLRPKDTSTLQKTESDMRLMADIFCIGLFFADCSTMWGCTKVTFPQPPASSLSLHPPLPICVSTTEPSYDVMPAVGLWLIWHAQHIYTQMHAHWVKREEESVWAGWATPCN